MVIGKIFIYWVTGDIAEENKVRLKINIVAYGGVAWVPVALGLQPSTSTAKSVSPTFIVRYQLKGNKMSYISLYIVFMGNKRCGIQIKLRRIFFFSSSSWSPL